MALMNLGSGGRQSASLVFAAENEVGGRPAAGVAGRSSRSRLGITMRR